jgi:hypothetical protein
MVQQHSASFIAPCEASTGSELPRFIKDEFDAHRGSRCLRAEIVDRPEKLCPSVSWRLKKETSSPSRNSPPGTLKKLSAVAGSRCTLAAYACTHAQHLTLEGHLVGAVAGPQPGDEIGVLGDKVGRGRCWEAGVRGAVRRTDR